MNRADRWSVSLAYAFFLTACSAVQVPPDAPGGADAGAVVDAPSADAPGQIDSSVSTDEDGDGSPSDEDCDDDDALVHPDAEERCNDVDDDCDTDVDEDPIDPGTFYLDADGDGYGVAGDAVVGCERPSGRADVAGDCDDASPTVHPGATEEDCTDPTDYNCDGSSMYADADADGIAACRDCDDTVPSTHPGAVESCNGADDDCDPATPDGASEAWLGAACDGVDSDACPEGVELCVDGARACGDLSDDTLELCNGVDDDCDGSTADGVHEPWLGVGCDGGDSDLCPEGLSACTDGMRVCSDTTGDILDLCNGDDEDCDPSTADGSHEPWLGSSCDGSDGDSCTEGILLCAGAAQQCSDASGDSVEICNGVDDECDGVVDDGCPTGISSDWSVESPYFRGPTGGIVSAVRCPGSRYVGFHGVAGSVVSRLGVMCPALPGQELYTDTSTVPYAYSVRAVAPATAGPALGSGATGAAFTYVCPDGTFMSGFDGRIGTYLERIRVHCRRFDVVGAPGSGWTVSSVPSVTSPVFGNTAGADTFTFDCPPGDLVADVAMKTTSGNVDLLQVGCATVTVFPRP